MNKPSNKSTPMSFADAAEEVLKSANTALHYKELTRRAIAQGLIQTSGKTPAATMYSVIHQEIKRKNARGESQRFRMEPKGFIHLEKDIPKGLAEKIDKHNENVRKELLKQILSMEPKEFEELIADLLTRMGFGEEIEITPQTRDGGIDVRGTLILHNSIKVKMAVQAKRWAGNVGQKVVQQVRGSLNSHLERGMIVTTGKFTTPAHKEANRDNAPPIALINGQQLVELMVELDHDLIEKQPQYLLSLRETADME